MPKFKKLRNYRPSGIDLGIFAKGGKRQIRITGNRDMFTAVETTDKNNTQWKEIWKNKKWILKKGISVLDSNKGETVYILVNIREKRIWKIYPDDFAGPKEIGKMFSALKKDAETS